MNKPPADNPEPASLWVAVAGATLLAAALRFPLLDRLPPGLYHDEAINGLDALRVLDGARPVFFTANNGREPLFIYLLAGSIAVLGRSALAIRIVSAALGTLTVPATYLMARRLFGRRIGLLAAIITAITIWPINLSRVGFRAVAMPLFTALTVWAFWHGYARDSQDGGSTWRWYILAGVFAGLMPYTYLTARFAPVVLLAFIGYLVLGRRQRQSSRQRAIHSPVTSSELALEPEAKGSVQALSKADGTQHAIPWRDLLLFACIAVIVASPLLGYFVTHRVEAAQRAFQVSILNPDISAGDPLGTLLRHIGQTLLMFNVRGDFIPRHNVPRRPVFDPLMSLFFLLGVGMALRRWRQPAYGLVLIWTAVMLLPTVLAEDAPHFLRAVGVLPILFVFPAMGLSVAALWLRDRWSAKIADAGLTVVLILSLSLTTYDYFVRHARSENTYYQFESGATELARDVNTFLRQNRAGLAYIDPILWDGWAAIQFLVPESPRVNVLPSDVAGAPAAVPVLLALWPFQDLTRYHTLLPQGSTISASEGAKERGDLESEARLLYVLLRAMPGSSTGLPLALFGDRIVLQEASVEPLPDGRLEVRLVWECQQSIATEFTITAQLLGPAGLITQDDGPPALGYYPTTAWRPGDRVADRRTLEPPTPYEPAGQQLIVALYDPATLERLPVTAPDGRPLGDHYILNCSLQPHGANDCSVTTIRREKSLAGGRLIQTHDELERAGYPLGQRQAVAIHQSLTAPPRRRRPGVIDRERIVLRDQAAGPVVEVHEDLGISLNRGVCAPDQVHACDGGR